MQEGLFVVLRQADAEPPEAAQEDVAESQQRVAEFFLVAGQAVGAELPAVARHRLEHRRRARQGGMRRDDAGAGIFTPDLAEPLDRVMRRLVQDQVANRRVDQAHLEHLGDAAAVGRHAAFHHHRKDHRRRHADPVVGALFELARGVQHQRQIRDHVALGQAGAEQQDARERAVFDEELLGALDLRWLGPVGQLRAFGDEVAEHLAQAGCARVVADQRSERRPLPAGPGLRALHVREQAGRDRQAPPLLAVRGAQRVSTRVGRQHGPGADDARHRDVGQRVGDVLHPVEQAVVPRPDRIAHALAPPVEALSACHWRQAANAASTGMPIAKATIERVSTGEPLAIVKAIEPA